MYVQFGAGLCGPSGWENFDASPTVRLQRLPVVGGVGKLAGPVFPDNVQYGDITKGLPVPDGKVDGVYASHVLEHLSYEDAHTALRNTFKMLRSGGIFRCIVPDLAERARRYVAALDQQSASAAHDFMRSVWSEWKRGRQARAPASEPSWAIARIFGCGTSFP